MQTFRFLYLFYHNYILYMEDLHMKKYTFDFYNSASLKAYNLNETMRYQLSILNKIY